MSTRSAKEQIAQVMKLYPLWLANVKQRRVSTRIPHFKRIGRSECCQPRFREGLQYSFFPTCSHHPDQQSLKPSKQIAPVPTTVRSWACPLATKSAYLIDDSAAQMYSSNRDRKSSSLPLKLAQQQIRMYRLVVYFAKALTEVFRPRPATINDVNKCHH